MTSEFKTTGNSFLVFFFPRLFKVMSHSKLRRRRKKGAARGVGEGVGGGKVPSEADVLMCMLGSVPDNPTDSKQTPTGGCRTSGRGRRSRIRKTQTVSVGWRGTRTAKGGENKGGEGGEDSRSGRKRRGNDPTSAGSSCLDIKTLADTCRLLLPPRAVG